MNEGVRLEVSVEEHEHVALRYLFVSIDVFRKSVSLCFAIMFVIILTGNDKAEDSGATWPTAGMPSSFTNVFDLREKITLVVSVVP